MSFFNEAFWFEKRGERYVYRPTVFSAGFDVSVDEKDALFRGLTQLGWRSLAEGAVLIALGAGAVLLGGVTDTREQITWFLSGAILGIAALAAADFRRRDRLKSRVLGNRAADVPRLSFRQALAQPRPMVGQRFAVPVLRSAGVLIGFATVAGDGLVAWLILTVSRAVRIAEGAEQVAAAERLASLTLHSPAFWLAVALFNAVSAAAVLFAFRQARRLRSLAGK